MQESSDIEDWIALNFGDSDYVLLLAMYQKSKEWQWHWQHLRYESKLELEKVGWWDFFCFCLMRYFHVDVHFTIIDWIKQNGLISVTFYSNLPAGISFRTLKNHVYRELKYKLRWVANELRLATCDNIFILSIKHSIISII